MSKVKNYIIAILILIVSILYFRYNKSRKYLEETVVNNKAYIAEITNVKKANRQFRYDINTLNNLNDSISLLLQKTKKELKIKDKNIEQLQYLQLQTNKKDTVIFNDTIFIENLKIDTLIKDPYRELNLKLEYPNKIEVETKFDNPISTIIHSKKEYVKPRKKLWILRLFQKKHTVVEATINIHNPYSKQKRQRFIKIIK